jgi:hypothetical protein
MLPDFFFFLSYGRMRLKPLGIWPTVPALDDDGIKCAALSSAWFTCDSPLNDYIVQNSLLILDLPNIHV